jgi:uncharacterized protein YggL (DUF469 family)
MKSFREFLYESSWAYNKVNEVLSKDDPIEKWIKDFIESDNPKFKGKSKDKRIEMAKAAYYAAQEED